MDAVLINPGFRKQIYQELGKNISAIEPPFWVAVIAAYLREQGLEVRIIDANAENFSPEQTAQCVAEWDPKLAIVVVYGSQPSASTQNMTAAGNICRAIKQSTQCKVAIGGLHPSALPLKTMEEEEVDFVADGEGVLTFEALTGMLKSGKKDYREIKGLWWRENGEIRHNERWPMIRDIDQILPLAAWDLLPMEKYRAHNWHCFDDIEKREPYGAIYTSLGCPYNCVFCCINAPFNKRTIRYRSPEIVVKEIGILVEQYQVKNLKIVDELFVLHQKHYMTILEMLIEKKYDLNIWAYARVDTVKPEMLKKMKQAGVNWLALGIESANPDVRDGASKKMRVNDIKQVVRSIQEAGIRVIGNFIFGLPDDTLATMQETLDMALELNCEFANFYSAMAYPGSPLYQIALEKKWPLPQEWHGYSQHSYETLPLPTRNISAAQVLSFRDQAFHKYYQNPNYLHMVEQKFGVMVREHIEEITQTRLKRKLLGN